MGKFMLRFRLMEKSRREALRLMQGNFHNEIESNDFLNTNIV